MKFTLVLALLAPIIAAMPAAEAAAENSLEARAGCGDGLCKGFQDSKLCDNRCKNCSGPSGKYSYGECGGFLWQTCRCFY
ncbi:hypothetical protein ACRALDRAFT_1062354 [Sodiomyces alcalophilus JCM 7366]|uniref:uncharacterized protein n=1 Tax=Sodiomyces alcalophilus JCM 7366 TaxID=591952 RepID=UPI0039B49181